MISTHSPAPLRLELRASRIGFCVFCLLAALALVLAPTIAPSVERWAGGAFVAASAVLLLQCIVLAYVWRIWRKTRSVIFGNGLVLHADGSGWRADIEGKVVGLDLSCQYFSRHLLVLQLCVDGRCWSLPILADQLSREDFRALRRALLHGRW